MGHSRQEGAGWGLTMRSTALAVAVFAISFISMPADPALADPRLTGMAIVKGTCKKLVIAGKDRSADCKGVLLNTDYDDQRTGFYFTLLDGGVITFSNRGDLEERPGPDDIVTPVDLMIIGQSPKQSINRLKAKGRCRHGNPFKGPSLLECTADSELGRFEGTFLSNGEKPELKTF
ncbi:MULTISPECIES: hypothetical protein [unclassified Bradyrhizobium]|uniref:hypothetical protein n=2 Tax=unclassified Bradyrhizobium TaxID=2631580 RepID=UPI0028EA576F|nr:MULTISPECIES: hypothetical protein [unclassified Bradyrhizobium]